MKYFFQLLLFTLVFFNGTSIKAQFIMDMNNDSTKAVGKGIYAVYKKFENLKFSGYIQPQYQYTLEKGAKSFIGGDFPSNSNNRFMLRRGRLRIDYSRFDKKGMPSLYFVFQFDGTERGVFIRDFFGRVFENRWNMFALTTGMFPRPFGYEVNLSSSDRESPERGRMSQILMKTERDLGAMVSFEPRNPKNSLRFLKADIGLFNGQGLAADRDFDSYKDLIARIYAKSTPLFDTAIWVSGGLSILQGGLESATKFWYTTQKQGNDFLFLVDSTDTNLGAIAPRHYRGADLQIKIPNGKHKGNTEFRFEYIGGTQTATASASDTPPTVPTTNNIAQPLYVRYFNGIYAYFLQNLGSTKHQIGMKYDFYDPNIRAKGTEIGSLATNFNATDIRYDTFGVGYLWYMNENFRLMLWYDRVKNEKTQLNNYTSDIKDDVLTCRVQYRF
jgi:hypothetical protein